MHVLSVRGEGDTLLLTLRGEIDFTSSAAITTAIREAVAVQRPRLVRVDLAEVTFLDSSGIGVLVAAMRAAIAVGAAYRVERPDRNVFDQLQLTGLVGVFGLHEPAPGAGQR